jgi:hypothetical protein
MIELLRAEEEEEKIQEVLQGKHEMMNIPKIFEPELLRLRLDRII